jgi:hypothetical protein
MSEIIEEERHVISFHFSGTSFGCCAYNMNCCTLMILSCDLIDSMEGIDWLLSQFYPIDSVLLNARIEEQKLTFLDQKLQNCKVIMRPPVDFDYKQSSSRLGLCLGFLSDREENSSVPWECSNFITSENNLSICCCGSIINFLSKIGNEIHAVKSFSLSSTLFISKESLSALSIFDSDSHP